MSELKRLRSHHDAQPQADGDPDHVHLAPDNHPVVTNLAEQLRKVQVAHAKAFPDNDDPDWALWWARWLWANP